VTSDESEIQGAHSPD